MGETIWVLLTFDTSNESPVRPRTCPLAVQFSAGVLGKNGVMERA